MLGSPRHHQEEPGSTTQLDTTHVGTHRGPVPWVGAPGNDPGDPRSRLVRALKDGPGAEKKNSSPCWNSHCVLGIKLLSFMNVFFLMFPCELVTVIIPSSQIQKLRLRKSHIARNEQNQGCGSKSNSSPPCYPMDLSGRQAGGR